MDQAITEIIIKLVSNPTFAKLMQQKIAMKVDTSALEQEIATHEKHLRQYHLTKSNLINEIDNLSEVKATGYLIAKFSEYLTYFVF